jgi:multidrug resistance efflux pump
LIQKTLVSEGDFVKKGDPLFIIFNETSKLNVDNAQIAADFADFSTKDDRLNELKVTIDIAKKKMMNDSMLWIRQKNLWVQEIGSKVELEQRTLTYNNSVASYQSAIFRFNELKKQLNFAASQAQKNLSISKTIQKDYTVRSQIDGRVYSILKEQGEIVTPQTPLLVMGDGEQFIIELQVDETDIAKTKIGQKVLISLDSYKGNIFEAKVERINPIMNERSRTFTVEATFIQKPNTLYPNLTTEANIVLSTKEKALTIPRTYLIDETFVMLENKEKRKVEIGLKDYQKVEILSGVTANDILLKPIK